MLQEVQNELTEVMEDEPEQETNELDGWEDHYIFSPSITKRRTIHGKTYIVRSYFHGKKDFKKIMCDHAFKQSLADRGEMKNASKAKQ